MSKKATRRAARQAFPSVATTGRRRDSIRGDRRSPAGKKRTTGGRQALRPPSWKRAVIQGIILAILYFVVIRFLWKQEGTTTASSLVVAVMSFVLFAGVAYLVDRFTYQRRLRKLKNPTK
jgi:Flp pilus assembly protein TadB